MSEGSTYVISQVVQKTGLKSHTIRYWEEELKLDIPRNNMGHRYYTDKDIKLFLRIKDLKSKGFQLKAIALMLPDLGEIDELDMQDMMQLKDEMNSKVIQLRESRYKDSFQNEGGEILDKQETDPVVTNEEDNEIVVEKSASEKLERFQQVMTKVIGNAMKTNNVEVTEAISEHVTDSVIKEMDYLFRIKEDHEEERFKKLDELIRDVQKSRQEVAATVPSRKKKKKGLFRRS
ncbi:MAG: helix-turn-helix domain-containing protein [bacterium]|nr:helix-turn-helix domain-containing protein [bacterium]